MSSSWQVLNADALREAALVAEPFPYLIIDNLIRPEVLAKVVESFPRIDKRGSFPPEAVSYSGRFVTLLLYLNPGWSAPEGRLRLLYNDHDLTRYAAEISPDAGRCLIFKVTPNCWHGHEPFDGERRTIQLNYVTSEEVRERDLKRHRFSAFLKGLLSRKDEKSPPH